jgi:homoserine acetyltransferase
VVSIGDFSLESGKTIHDCRIGFHAAGEVNEDLHTRTEYPEVARTARAGSRTPRSSPWRMVSVPRSVHYRR